MMERLWNDIGYNFLAGGDGFVYEGRGWDAVGREGWDSDSIGVCFVGNFNVDEPSGWQTRAFLALIEWGVASGKVRPDYKLVAACQRERTESPGQKLYREMQKWGHWHAAAATTAAPTCQWGP